MNVYHTCEEDPGPCLIVNDVSPVQSQLGRLHKIAEMDKAGSALKGVVNSSDSNYWITQNNELQFHGTLNCNTCQYDSNKISIIF